MKPNAYIKFVNPNFLNWRRKIETKSKISSNSYKNGSLKSKTQKL